ncbi:hypothetical protein Scep_015843 [Stephania cephalantha]|uniref:Fe2OG dioxygenase domain-containing protein n=1 Tax=Stephania cephalantha TaxID=152367 RepID=A0AAP0P0S2_9MAGN
MGFDGENGIENEKAPNWATSIPVDNVQEMVRRNSYAVPEKYIRNLEDRHGNTCLFSASTNNIPVIDLSLLTDNCKEELKKLDLSCAEWGFFQVINHGIAQEILLGMKDAAVSFFELPLEEKEKYSMPPNDIQGYGHAYVASTEQKLDWSDALIMVVYPTHYRKYKYWPATPPELKDAIEAYSFEVNKVAIKLLSYLSLIVGMDKEGLLGMHKEIMQALRLNYYPPCSKPDQVIGLSPHSDTSTISILMQDEDVTGLQIRHDGEWVSVKPIPNSLVVNIGDVIEIWSNGKYKSIEHRAVINDQKARISYASFICPNDDVEIEPLKQTVGCQEPKKLYKKIRCGDFLRQSMKRKMEGKAHTDVAKIEKNIEKDL